MRFPELAETIETVAEKGREGFYEGPVAEEIARSVQDEGGILSAEDLASQRSDWVDPISTTYRGLTCYQHPPNSQGFAHLMMLNILEGFDLHSMGEDSADYLHLLVEATKAVFVDRDRYLTDPEFADIPLEQLLSKEYAAELRASIDMNRSRSPAATKSPAGDTTYSAVVDAEGNAASVIQSLYYECGSAFVAGGSGVCLQNRGSFFSLDEEQTNRLEPGKRTFHTLMPGMLFQDGLPSMIYGTMGGEGQPQTQTALVTRTVDFGHDIQSAIDRPRWLYGRTWGETTSDLRVESRIPEAVVSMLRARNHPVRVVEEWSDAMGHAQGIVLDHERSVLMGGADPRGEGIAIGW
jgi:gamma-glutamyltranspeptidase/glutathione hydrolase